MFRIKQPTAATRHHSLPVAALSPLLGVVLVLSACGGPESEEQPGGVDTVAVGECDVLGDWDADADGVIVETEYNDWYGEYGIFADWDADADGLYDVDEVTTGVYDTWDTDGDGVYSELEWNEWTDTWYVDDVDYGTYADWDGDGDGELIREEFDTGFEEYGTYADWDADVDGVLDENELTTGVYDTWDADASDSLDEVEWATGTETVCAA